MCSLSHGLSPEGVFCVIQQQPIDVPDPGPLLLLFLVPDLGDHGQAGISQENPLPEGFLNGAGLTQASLFGQSSKASKGCFLLQGISIGASLRFGRACRSCQGGTSLIRCFGHPSLSCQTV